MNPVLYLRGQKDLPGKLGAAVALARCKREESQLCPSSRSLLFSARKEGHSKSVSTSVLKRMTLLRERVRSDSRVGGFLHESLYYRRRRGRYYKCDVVVRDWIEDLVGPGFFYRNTPLKAMDLELFWVTREQAARWYMTEPDEAPEDLRPLAAEYDYTEDPAPPVFEPPATTAPETDGRTPETPPAPPLDPRLKATEAPCSESMEAIDETDQQVLSALFSLRAFDEGSSVKAGVLRPRIGKLSDRKYKASIARLKLDFVQTKPGPDGGAWLTENGRNLVQSRAHETVPNVRD